MQIRRQFVKGVAGLWILLSLAACLFAQNQSAPNSLPTLVEVYWQSSRTIVAPGLTNIVILDPDIAQVSTGYETVQFTGLERGETIMLAYLNGTPISVRVRVVQRPQIAVAPSLLQRQAEMAQGSVSSNIQVARFGGSTSVTSIQGISWAQLVGTDGHFSFTGQFENPSFASGHDFNFRSASAFYYDPRIEVRAIDTNVNLTGSGLQPNLTSYGFSDFVALRGASVTLNRGDNHYDFYAGTTIPYYYLSLGGTRDVAGFSFRRQQTKDLELFAATTYLNAPIDFLGTTSPRRNSVMQDIGARWHPARNWIVQGIGGVSNHGGLLRGEFAYTGTRTTLFGSTITSSVLYPLNQLGSLLSGNTSFRVGSAYKQTDWLTELISYQHVIVPGYSGITSAGHSDYVNPGFTLRIGQKQNIAFNYTYSESSGGFSNESATGNRFDTGWQYQFTPKISNAAQFTIGSLQDPLQLNSEDQYMVRDTVSFPVKNATIFVGFEHDQTNPSLVQKLRDELSLLSPELQNLFLSDPVSFVNSSNLPPEIRALLNAQNMIGTSASASAQFHIGTKINLGPSFSIVRSTDGKNESWTPYFGYGLAYRVRPSLQLTSALSNEWVLANTTGNAQHTTIFSFGITKTFMASPEMFLAPLHHPRVIEGRVFRDNNVRGAFHAGDAGFSGLQVRLDTGETTVTDDQGRYKFSAVSGGVRKVSLDVTQFGQPVRMTTKASSEVDLVRASLAVVNFGVVDFARLSGAVFNDLRFEGKRQPDSKGMPEINLILDNGTTKRTITSQNGEYELEDLAPGDYTVSIDDNTVPANYTVPTDSFPIHISPVSSVVLDVPVHALRSIAGRVFLKVSDGKAAPTMLPMSGITLKADGVTATTDKNGNFLLRHLPAGDLTIVIVPVRPLPPGMKVPSGPVHMPAEPIEVKGATIVISNPDLVPYLIGKTAQDVRDAASLNPGP